MVKNIVKDIFFLSQKSLPATKEDIDIITDLKDTLFANRNGCVGMAANMIGYLKQILIYEDENKKYNIMINPIILNKSGKYVTEEGCLSLTGVRQTTRFRKIKVEYLNENFEKRIKTFNDFVAQIIQHEIDHFSGIII